MLPPATLTRESGGTGNRARAPLPLGARRWDLEAAWAPLLFRDEVPPARTDPVTPRGRSAAAAAKERDHVTPDELPVGGFGRLLAHLATLTEHRVIPAGLDDRAGFWQQDEPTALQTRAFELLGFTPAAV